MEDSNIINLSICLNRIRLCLRLCSECDVTMRKPNLDEREYYNLLELLKDLGLEIKGSMKFPQPKPLFTKDFQQIKGGRTG